MIWYGLSGLEICCESVLKYEIVKALPISSGQRLADATAKFHQEPEEPDKNPQCSTLQRYRRNHCGIGDAQSTSKRRAAFCPGKYGVAKLSRKIGM